MTVDEAIKRIEEHNGKALILKKLNTSPKEEFEKFYSKPR